VAYMRLGMMLLGDSRGIGVIGVCDVPYLKPTHNKQNFVNTAEYHKLKKALESKMRLYWKACRISEIGIAKFWHSVYSNPRWDEYWVQCESCRKWRRVPTKNDLPKGSHWTCSNSLSSCDVPEEKELIHSDRSMKELEPLPASHGQPIVGQGAGSAWVGRKVNMYFAKEFAWRSGTIIEFSHRTGKYKIHYEDDSKKWDFFDHDMKILDNNGEPDEAEMSKHKVDNSEKKKKKRTRSPKNETAPRKKAKKNEVFIS